MKWENLRLETSVMSRLRRYRSNLENAIAAQPGRYDAAWQGKRLSLSDALEFLLDAKDRHRGRTATARRQPALPATECPDTL